MIKTIIFDIGGVVTHTDFDAIYTNFAKCIGLSPAILIDYRQQKHKDLILGSITLEGFWNDMKKLGANTNLDFKSLWLESALKDREIDRDVLKTIAILRKNYSVGALSNLMASRLIVDEVMKIYDNFDFRILSIEEHLSKPDPKFYQLALNRAGVKAEEAIFVDDQERCTKPAEQMGMRAILFKDNAGLVTNLRKLGVLV